MKFSRPVAERGAAPQRVRAFTLAELLVVMGIIAVLGVLTLISAQRIMRDSRVASATNTVTATLGSARSLAIRTNNAVVVAFRPVWDSTNRQRPQQTELVVAEWSKRAFAFSTDINSGAKSLADWFVPSNSLPPVRLPIGVKVAGPLYEAGLDSTWATQGDMAAAASGCTENIYYSRMVGVMFGPDGTLVTRLPQASGADAKTFIDFNNSGTLGALSADPQDVGSGTCANGDYELYWTQDHVDDEPNLTLVPLLSVYDDRAARERKSLDWSVQANVANELTGPTGYISNYGSRIFFNRYTGVARVEADQR